MERLRQQLEFIIEIDSMKNILRRTLIMDGSRRENDAEHSWHISIMAMILQEYSEGETDITRVIKMLLVHDLVEIYAGDTYAYDEQGALDKEEREIRAADKLFGHLPPDQQQQFRELWDEFELGHTLDARYAACMDRLQPLLHNYVTKGHTWKEGNVDSAKIYKRMSVIESTAPRLWEVVEYIINDSIEKGYLRK